MSHSPCLIPLNVILRNLESTCQFASNKDKINHLLFIDDLKLYAKSEKGLDSLVQTVRIFNYGFDMEIDIDRCATLVPKKGKITKADRISLLDGRSMKGLIERAG